MITHGNGPQVGNLLVKNELAAAVVPPVPLDWCGAQTQATLGFVLMDALDAALAGRGVDERMRDGRDPHPGRPDDPGFVKPTKPIGRFLPAEEAALLVEHGEVWEDRGEKGWRRVVASPEPLRHPRRAGGAAADRGGVRGRRERRRRDPRRTPGGRVAVGRRGGDRQGPRRGAARRLVDADVLVVATDVPQAVLRFGTPEAEPIGRVDAVARCRSTPPRGTSRAGRWGRRSTPCAASCRAPTCPA